MFYFVSISEKSNAVLEWAMKHARQCTTGMGCLFGLGSDHMPKGPPYAVLFIPTPAYLHLPVHPYLSLHPCFVLCTTCIVPSVNTGQGTQLRVLFLLVARLSLLCNTQMPFLN